MYDALDLWKIGSDEFQLLNARRNLNNYTKWKEGIIPIKEFFHLEMQA